MSKLRGAVIGVGYLGNFHAQKVKGSEHATLVGVFDQYAPQADKIANDLGVKAFKNLEEIPAQVDFVTIAAATQAHYELAAFFLKNKIAVLVEKPIAATSQQGYELSALAKANGVVFSVGHIERFNPSYKIVKDSADKTKYFEINRLAPFRARGADVSVLHDLMIHDLDLVQYLFNSEIENFMVYGHKFIKDTIDDVSVRLRLKSGVQVTINNSRLNPTIVRNYRAVQTDRTIYVNTATLEGEILTSEPADPFYKTEKFNIEKVDSLNLEINHFIRAVKKEVPVAITGEEASLALANIEKILAEIKS
ncbi:MAG: Gfo/Idh/MocA family oxidoreductase [Bdellovibrionota bacterium]